MSNAVCSFFNSEKWIELNRSAFLTVESHNPENLIFQLLPVKEKFNNPYKNNRIEKINEIRYGVIIDTLTTADIDETVKCGVNILEVFDGIFCLNLEYNPYTELVTDMFEKRALFKLQGRNLLQDLA